MKTRKIQFITLLTLLSATCFAIADSAEKVTVEKYSDTIYKFMCKEDYAINILASVGKDGILVIDTGFSSTAEELLKKLKQLGDVKLVVVTHVHDDHTAGNRFFSREAIIISHKNVAKTLKERYIYYINSKDSGYETILIDEPITLHFNGEEIKIIPLPPGHSDGDLIVHFTGSKIVALGDVHFPDTFPFIDLNIGGDVNGYLKNLKWITETFSPDIKFISGHRMDMTIEQLKDNYIKLAANVSVIYKAFDEGKTGEQIVNSDLLKKWDEWGKSFTVSTGLWVQIVQNQWRRMQPDYKPSIAQAMLGTIFKSGIDEAIKFYNEQKIAKSPKFDASEAALNLVSYSLLAKKKIDDAITIFQLMVKEYPDSWNAYDSIAEAYMTAGNNELAIKYYEKSLELNPNNENAKKALQKLR